MATTNPDGSIVLSIRVDEDELRAKLGGIPKKTEPVSRSFSALGRTIAAAFSVRAIIQFSKQSGLLATQTEASVQRLISIYGSASKSVGDFIDANSYALGMSRAAAASYASVYGNLFSAWVDQATNAELTNQYLNMTAVIASKTGRTVADVQERVRSGLLGNTEAIEDLGVFVNVKTIEITGAFQRIANGRSWEQLSAYEQQQVRTLAILEQSTQKYGSQVAETSALARSQFKAAYEDLQATWGQVINTILMPIMKWATTGIVYINGLLTGLFNLSSETIKQSDAIGSAVKNQNNLTDAVKETNKEAKKGVASFDELNTLTEQSTNNIQDNSNNGTSALNANGFAISPQINTESFEKGISAGTRLREVFEPLINIFGEFGSVVAVVVIALLGFVAVKRLLGWLTGLGKPMTTIAAGFGSFIEKLGSAGIAISILGGLALVLNSITGLVVAFSESGLTLGDVAGLLGIVLGEVVIAFASLLGILKLLNPRWQDIAFAVAVFGSLYLILKQTTNMIKAFSESGRTLGEIAGLLATVLGSVLVLITGITVAANILGSNPLALVAVATIGLVVVGVFESLARLIPVVSDAIHKFFTNIPSYVDNTIYAVSKLINFLISGIEYMVNRLVIDGVNRIINGINTVGKYVGFTIPSVPAFNIPRFIPKLAQGAVIPGGRPFYAMLGDQPAGQTNIEAPLDTIKQAFADVAAQMGSGDIILMVDGREIARANRSGEGKLGAQTVMGGFANVY